MTIGELIARLESYPEDFEVIYDFAYTQPTTVGSWRGVYSEAALGWKPYGYSGDEQHPKHTVKTLLEELRTAIDGSRAFQSWKSGEYTYDANTPIHVDNDGDYSSTEIVATVGSYKRVVLLTHMELS